MLKVSSIVLTQKLWYHSNPIGCMHQGSSQVNYLLSKPLLRARLH